nr:methyltransferase domain-containing protein [Marinifilum breve]
MVGINIENMANYFNEMDCEVIVFNPSHLIEKDEYTKLKSIEEFFKDLQVSRKIDVIIFHKSFELINNYREFFKIIASNLYPESVIYIETIARNLLKIICNPQKSGFSGHYLFTKQSLSNLMRKYGYQLVAQRCDFKYVFMQKISTSLFKNDLKKAMCLRTLHEIAQKLLKVIG